MVEGGGGGLHVLCYAACSMLYLCFMFYLLSCLFYVACLVLQLMLMFVTRIYWHMLM